MRALGNGNGGVGGFFCVDGGCDDDVCVAFLMRVLSWGAHNVDSTTCCLFVAVNVRVCVCGRISCFFGNHLLCVICVLLAKNNCAII